MIEYELSLIHISEQQRTCQVFIRCFGENAGRGQLQAGEARLLHGLSLIHISTMPGQIPYPPGNRPKECKKGKRSMTYDKITVSYTHLDVYKRQGAV